jgi:uncharacterized protein
MRIAGFEWDFGNWPKCGKHGVTQGEIEDAIRNARFVIEDPSNTEPRLRAVGLTDEDRHVFVAFTLRRRDGLTFVRPISARFMHAKEIRDYERRRPEEP